MSPIDFVGLLGGVEWDTVDAAWLVIFGRKTRYYVALVTLAMPLTITVLSRRNPERAGP